jgi:hypothetical protein
VPAESHREGPWQLRGAWCVSSCSRVSCSRRWAPYWPSFWPGGPFWHCAVRCRTRFRASPPLLSIGASSWPPRAPAAGTKRRANGHLALAGRGAREKQAGDVGAGDDQDDTDPGQEHQQPTAHAGTNQMIPERADPNAHPPIPFRVRALESGPEVGHLSARVLDRYIGAKARNRLEVQAVAAPSDPFTRRDDIWHPQVGRIPSADGVCERRWHHANHVVGIAIQRHFPGIRSGLR